MCPGLSCASPAPCLACKPALWVATEKHPIATLPWKTLSWHKILCRDTRRLFSGPKPGPALNPVAKLNFFCDTGLTNLCRDREGLCHDPNHPAYLETVSQHRARKLCRTGTLHCRMGTLRCRARIPADLAHLSGALRPSHAPSLRSLS